MAVLLGGVVIGARRIECSKILPGHPGHECVLFFGRGAGFKVSWDWPNRPGRV